MDIEDRDAIAKLFLDEQFDIVVNLAAQAGGTIFSGKSPCVY